MPATSEGDEPSRTSPRRGARPAARARAATLGRLRPWVDWFGAGRRSPARSSTVVVVVGGGWWLLRSPATADRGDAAVRQRGDVDRAAGAGVDDDRRGRRLSSSTSPVPSPRPASTSCRPGRGSVDALDAAGGAVAEADAGCAQPRRRPRRRRSGSTCPRSARPSRADVAAVAGPGSTAPAGPVDLNRATAAELDELPGIGPATAQAIVDHRAANGPFASVDDLEAVRGIGPAKLEAIRGAGDGVTRRVGVRSSAVADRRERATTSGADGAEPDAAGEPGVVAPEVGPRGHRVAGRPAGGDEADGQPQHGAHGDRRSGTATSPENGAPTASSPGAANTPRSRPTSPLRCAVEHVDQHDQRHSPATSGGTRATNGPRLRIRLRYQRGPSMTCAGHG